MLQKGFFFVLFAEVHRDFLADFEDFIQDALPHKKLEILELL
jgi:hypothetical protein